MMRMWSHVVPLSKIVGYISVVFISLISLSLDNHNYISISLCFPFIPVNGIWASLGNVKKVEIYASL